MIAILYGTDAFGRSGIDQIPRFERKDSGHEVHQFRDGEDHVLGRPRLADFAVDAHLNLHVLGIADLIGLSERAERRKRVEALRDGPRMPVRFRDALDISSRHVESDAVRGDVLEGLRTRDISASFPNDGDQFNLVMHIGRLGGEEDHSPRSHERRRWLEKNHGLLGDVTFHLGGMPSVVSADAEDFSDGLGALRTGKRDLHGKRMCGRTGIETCERPLRVLRIETLISSLSRWYSTQRSKAEVLMYAIVDIKDKQFKVRENETAYVPYHDDLESGSEVVFDRVLLVSDGAGDVTLGTPVVDDAAVHATILEHVRGDKVIVFKKKRRKRYKVKHGHRQQYTKIRIDALTNGTAAAPAAEADTEDEPAEEPADAEE